MKRAIPKRCARCQQEFTCGLSGCWCSQITIPESQYAVIRDRYHDCLCPACLRQVSIGELDLTAEQPESSSSESP
ncbi:MAG: hypothetical protein D6690_06425 [Nitrospirae bacterium]|nr:MAG: hypothetical protein D6690_06425 [Nitrospirota bacterium]